MIEYSPRLLLSVTGLLFGLVASTSFITAPIHLILIVCIFIGIGMSTHDVVTLSSIAKSFDKRLGIMTELPKQEPRWAKFVFRHFLPW